MSLDSLLDIGDFRLATLDAESLAPLAAKIKELTGVTLKVFGGRITLTHDASGAFLVKEPGLTIQGAVRTALHMQKCMAEPDRVRENEHIDRHAHARRAEARRKF